MEIKTQSLYKQSSEVQEQLEENTKYSYGRIRGFILVLATLGLAIFSLLNIASASFYRSLRFYKKEYFFVERQLVFLILGLFILCAGLAINYNWYRKIRTMKLIIFGSFLMLLIVLVGSILKINALVPMVNGSRRWINIGITRLQPSELLKIAFIIIIANILANCRKQKLKNMQIITMVSPIVLGFVFFVFAQKDLGTAIHYMAIVLVMLFFTNIELKRIYQVITGVLLIGFIYIGYSYSFGSDTSYRTRRIRAYINGVIYDNYDNGDGYQIKQSLIAIGNGGVLGKGLGNGTQKYSYLPEIHTDFILASVGEEWGFLGVSMMFIVYIIILQIGMAIAKSAKDDFGRYIAIGITGYLFTQIIMNVYVVTGLMPVTGIPLPLMSYGGTSLWTTLFAVGVLYNINKRSLGEEAVDAD